VQVHDEVRDALAAGRPVVALESTIISHGLPRPDNARLAREFEQAVRDGGAVPATIAVIDGEPHIGLDDAALDRLANDDSTVKVSVRELATIAARGGVGATTVASTAHLAAGAVITVFATGGLGGVHRGAQDTFDESADLTTLAHTGVLVVCAGVKSILDVGATLERLETLGVGVLGYRTDRFPGFYLADSGHDVGWLRRSRAGCAARTSRRSCSTGSIAKRTARRWPRTSPSCAATPGWRRRSRRRCDAGRLRRRHHGRRAGAAAR
jgi:pseudouridine-5'-phosphate glycosidase